MVPARWIKLIQMAKAIPEDRGIDNQGDRQDSREERAATTAAPDQILLPSRIQNSRTLRKIILLHSATYQN